MKRLTAVMLCFILVLSACGTPAAGGSAETLQEYLLTRSLAQTRLLGSMAQSEEYGALYSYSPEVLSLMQEIGALDFETPAKAVVVQLPADAIRGFLEEEMGSELHLPGEISDLMEVKMFEAIPSIMMGQQGTNLLVVSSLLGFNKSYRKHSELTENTMVVLLYPGGYHSLTSFVESEEETVIVRSGLIVFPDTIMETLEGESLERFLTQEMNFEGVTVEYLDPATILGQ